MNDEMRGISTTVKVEMPPGFLLSAMLGEKGEG
jgi:hypothetical protein